MSPLFLCFALFSFVCLPFFATAQTSQWTPVDRDYASISLGLSFQSTEQGWISGSTSAMQPLLLETTDGAKTFKNYPPVNITDAAFVSMAFSPDGKTGLVGSLGFVGLACGAYTPDGHTWQATHQGKELLCDSLGVSVPDDQTLVLIGSWVSSKDHNGNGAQISTDGGQTWASQDWGFKDSDYVEARYGYFFSGELGYVTGGTWPENDTSLIAGKSVKRLSKFLYFDGERTHIIPHTKTQLPTDNYGAGWAGYIASAKDAASEWTLLQNLTDTGIYFNQISCVDPNTCWAACEGVNVTTGEPVANIYATTDGWSTFTVQFSYPGSIMTIQMLNATTGFAAGGILPTSEADGAGLEGAVISTTDGITWTQSAPIRGVYFTDLSMIDANNGYATALSESGLATLLKYAPSS